VLLQPIVAGRGQVRLEDTFWDVEGNDLPLGTPVVVTSVEGHRLRVEAVN
jgi:inner membrane protein